MIENSVDAGAKNITVEIKNGGSTYIRITDDGSGIEKEQVSKVFIAHATSKIAKKDDLYAIGTLGFRGEAMASVCAVAKVELLTKAENEEVGTRYEIAGGQEIAFDDAGCPKGTTIVVRDLFYNTPARMKFLKKDVTEGNNVAGIVDRMAISHPEISFRFIRDGKQTLVTSGNGDLKSTLYSVFGKDVSENLIKVDYTFENMKVSGYVSKPIASRKSRALQFFFINGRLVKSKTAVAAVEQAYKNSIMVGRFPMCVLNIELNPSLVDVNVHPAKTEVRFANEKPVFSLVYYGVKTAVDNDSTVKEAKLGDSNFTPVYTPSEAKHTGNIYASNDSEKIKQINYELFKKKDDAPIQQKFKVKANDDFWSVSAPPIKYDTNEKYGGKNLDIEYTEETAPENSEAKPNTETPEFKSEKQVESEQSVIVADEKDNTHAIPDFKLVGQAFSTYIIVEIENELYIIDKHAAHERINYETLKSQATVETQMLLAPIAVNLSKDEFTAVCENESLIKQCGFETEVFGESQIIVRAVPSLVIDCDIKDLIIEIAQKLLEHKTDIIPEKIDWIYHSASCRSAVKAGDYTSAREQELFVKKLLSMPNIRFCPHGRPVFIKLSKYDIEKQFGRVQ